MAKNDVQKLLGEALILSQLDHKNIVRFLDVKETASNVFIEMELATGGTLQNLMQALKKQQRWFTEVEAASIMQAIFEAIDYIHSKDIIHRDLKPENILIQDEHDLASIKVCDFGLSLAYEAYKGINFTQQCGTLKYMAPEFFTTKIYSKPIDIWSASIILYQLCAGGKHPIADEEMSSEQYKKQLVNPQWVFPKEFPLMAKNLFLRSTHINP